MSAARCRPFLIVVVSAIVGACSPTAALGQVSYPPAAPVPDATAFSGAPALRVDPAGRVNLAWLELGGGPPAPFGYRISFVRYLPDGTFTDTVAISDGSAAGLPPDLDVDSAGVATIVWKDEVGIELATVAADGTVGAKVLLADTADPNALGRPSVAVTPEGRATVVWSERAIRATLVHSISIDEQGRLGPVETLSPPGRASGPLVAADPSGRATVVWQQRPARRTGAAHLDATRLSPAGEPGRVRRVSPLGRTPEVPELAVDANGRSTVIWRERRKRSDRVRSVRLASNGVPARPRTLSPPRKDLRDPDLAVDRRGRVTVGWERRGRIELVRLAARGLPGKVWSVDDGSPGRPSGPELAADPAGRVVAAWSHCCGQSRTDLQSVVIGRGGRPGRPLEVPVSDGVIDELAVGIDSAGRPSLAWSSRPRPIQFTRGFVAP